MRLSSGILAGLLAVGTLGAQGPPPDLFQDADSSKDGTSKFAVEQNESGLTPVRKRLVRLNLAAIDPDAPSVGGRRRVRLNLFPGLDPEIEESRSRRGLARRSFEWFGGPSGDAASDVVLSVVEGRVSGSLALRQGFFQIRHVEGELHEISEVLFDRSQPVDDAMPPPVRLPLSAEAKTLSGPMAAPAGGPVVDVLIVYTSGARRKAGGSQAIQDRIHLAIAEANASFVNSQAAIEFRLAGMAEMELGGTPAPTSSFLSQVTQSEPDILSLRDYFGADLVSVWVENTAGGVIGIGWLNPGPPFDFSSYGYGVVTASYSGGPFYTFSHEAGHNLGGAHDRAHATNPGAFAYSYGYRYDPNPGGGFYTVMSYSSGCGGCSASNRWSNPNILIDGVPAGRPQSAPDSADNAATLSQIAPSASQFRATQAPPVNYPPTAVDRNLTVTSSSPTPIALAGADPNGHTIFFDVVAQPQHGVLEGAGASWTYTSDLGYAGPDSFQFQVRDHLGGFDVGTVSLNVQLAATIPPNVSLAAPSGGPFTEPATINLVATASDPDGSVDHVDFFADGALIGSATSATSTFTFQWRTVLEGDYTVTASAHDDRGAVSGSNAIAVRVGAGGTLGFTTRTARLFYAFDEGAGNTVYDHIGGQHGTIGGAASWVSPGLQGGYVNSGVTSFSGNKLSAASGNAFTIVWVGKLGSATGYQTLFSMADTSKTNVQLAYYKPNGYLYLTVNGGGANLFNAKSLLDKNVLIAVRCAGGSCAWRVGGAGAWRNSVVGTALASTPLLQVGADANRWAPLVNTASALFWVYGASLTDAEIDANFQFAGATLAARGAALDGYIALSANSNPVAQDQTLTTPYQTARIVTLSATDPDLDTLTYSVLAGPAHGALSGAPPNLTYTPASGYSGPDSFTFRASDGRGGLDTGLISITVSAPSGGGSAAYTTRAARLFYAFDEGAGTTVFDHIGSNDGTVAGAASWASPGLRGGYVNSGVTSFSGNKLSVASGNAFTVIWVGKLGAADAYQTLFSMADTSNTNLQLAYYKPNGYLYLTLNGRNVNFNVKALLDKNVMIAIRCSGGSCAWRVGGAGVWRSGLVGTAVASSPLLQVGADARRWAPLVNATSALFWVYGASLTDAEINANFQFAGATLGARGAVLDGYTAQ